MSYGTRNVIGHNNTDLEPIRATCKKIEVKTQGAFWCWLIAFKDRDMVAARD